MLILILQNVDGFSRTHGCQGVHRGPKVEPKVKTRVVALPKMKTWLEPTVTQYLNNICNWDGIGQQLSLHLSFI